MTDEAVRELDHTADIGFEAEAPSLDRLFRLAARGLVSALGVSADPEGEVETGPLELDRPDLERLLVAWLRELLHRSTAERLVPEVDEVRVRREVGEGTPGSDDVQERAVADDGEARASLAARLSWRPWADGPVREIKGVTYHGLRVAERGDGWHARVVLDV